MLHISKPSITEGQKQKLKGMLFLGITVMVIMIAYNLIYTLG